MPFVSDEDDYRVKYSVHVWRDDEDDEGIRNPYTTEEEARAAFYRLEAGKEFGYGGIYRWVEGKRDWDCLDAWPDQFDGFNPIIDRRVQ
jgi:hypothetical protein